MLLLKNWKSPSKFLILTISFFLVGCSTYTMSVRPSFDDNYKNKLAQDNANIRPSKKDNTSAKFSQHQKEDEESQEIEEDGEPQLSSRGGEYKKAADKYLGTPYHWGGTTKRGFDCSGFVWKVFQDAGHTDFPRETAQTMFNKGKSVSQNTAREGDLVFFYSPRSRKKIDHAGIYISDQRFIHSSSTNGVAYSKLGDAYWKDNFAGFKRMF